MDKLTDLVAKLRRIGSQQAGALTTETGEVWHPANLLLEAADTLALRAAGEGGASLTPLSEEAWNARRPAWPPEVLANATQSENLVETGRTRPAKAVKTMNFMQDVQGGKPQGCRESDAGERAKDGNSESARSPLERPASAAPSQQGGMPDVEAAKKNADYWLNAGREEADRGNAVLMVEQAMNAWKNCAYALRTYAQSLREQVLKLEGASLDLDLVMKEIGHLVNAEDGQGILDAVSSFVERAEQRALDAEKLAEERGKQVETLEQAGATLLMANAENKQRALAAERLSDFWKKQAEENEELGKRLLATESSLAGMRKALQGMVNLHDGKLMCAEFETDRECYNREAKRYREQAEEALNHDAALSAQEGK